MDPHQRLLLEAERRLTRQARQAFDRGLGGRLASPSPLAPGEVYGGAGANIQVGSAPAGEWIHLTATTAHLAGADDVLTFDTVAARSRFDSTPSAGTIVLPRTGVYAFALWFQWASYLFGGAVKVEVDGTVVREFPGSTGLGNEFEPWSDTFVANAGDQLRILITLPAGTSDTCDAVLTLAAVEPIKETAGQATYEEVVLGDGPVGYWRLGESSGTTAADSSGNGHDGTYENTPTLGVSALIADDPDTAVTFARASSERVLIGDVDALEFAGTDPFTVEAWVSPAAVGAAGTVYNIVTKLVSRAPTDQDGWSLHAVSDGTALRFEFERWNGMTGQGAVESSYSRTVGTTYHVVGVYDGNAARLYVDAVQVGDDSTAVSLPSTTVEAYIAAAVGGSSPAAHFDGTIDEVAVYDRALVGEIADHYAAGT